MQHFELAHSDSFKRELVSRSEYEVLCQFTIQMPVSIAVLPIKGTSVKSLL